MTTWTLVSRAAGLLCLLTGVSGFAQTATAPAAARTASIASTPPLRTLYRHFLAFQNHLDRLATARERQGKDGTGLRTSYQKQLGFTDAQFSSVREAGLRLESGLLAEDAKAKPVLDAIRAQRLSALKTSSSLPPLPPEVASLQNERDSIIDQEMARLKSELGPEAAAKLDNYLQRVFSTNVKVQNVPPHPAHGVYYRAIAPNAAAPPADPNPVRRAPQ